MNALAPKDPIIVALDNMSLEEAETLVIALKDHVGGFKIGLELFVRVGPIAITMVHRHGGRVFLDLKYKDIPATMAGAAKAAAAHRVWMFNLHASNQLDAIRSATENRGGSLALGVTVLTSMIEADCQYCYNLPIKVAVLLFAHKAKLGGCDGLVCSPQEIALIRQDPGLKNLLLVVPGVRPLWAATGDQKRTMTPGEAIRAGADYLVIGRPITNPPRDKFATPSAALANILEEIQDATETKSAHPR